MFSTGGESENQGKNEEGGIGMQLPPLRFVLMKQKFGE